MMSHAYAVAELAAPSLSARSWARRRTSPRKPGPRRSGPRSSQRMSCGGLCRHGLGPSRAARRARGSHCGPFGPSGARVRSPVCRIVGAAKVGPVNPTAPNMAGRATTSGRWAAAHMGDDVDAVRRSSPGTRPVRRVFWDSQDRQYRPCIRRCCARRAARPSSGYQTSWRRRHVVGRAPRRHRP